MKKQAKTLLTGILIGATLTSGLTFAKQISETAELFYNNIKIYINGAEIVPKDPNGNIVEPFTMNGTTYLPVRAVSNALGQDVEWDGETQSVYIGKKDKTKPDNYLYKIQHNDYKESHPDSDFAIINGTISDYNNNNYTNGILFYLGLSEAIAEDKDGASVAISYPLNSVYTNLKGKIVLPKNYDIASWGKKDDPNTSSVDVLFYGDDKLLYKATSVTSSMPFDIDINTTGVNNLQIKFVTYDWDIYGALTDLALFK